MKFLPLLICGSLLTPEENKNIQDVLSKPYMYEYFDNCYAVLCANSKLSKLFEQYVDECIKHLRTQLLIIQQHYFKQFQESVIAHDLSNPDLISYLHDYLMLSDTKSPNTNQLLYGELVESCNQIDPHYRQAFIAIDCFINNKVYTNVTFNPSLRLSDQRFWLRLFLKYTDLQIHRHKYECVNPQSSDNKAMALIHTVQTKSLYHATKIRDALCMSFTEQFSVYQLRSPLLPYFGLICDPMNTDNIWGIMRFDVYKHEYYDSEPHNVFSPLFMPSPVSVDDHQKRIKLIILNLIMTAPGFDKYCSAIKQIARNRAKFFNVCTDFDKEWDNMMLQFIDSIQFDSQSSGESLCSANKQSRKIFAPVYRIDPTTRQVEENLYLLLQGKLGQNEYLTYLGGSIDLNSLD